MYEIYTTKSYILRTYTSKENDQRVLLFSRDFGLIWANASGSKKEASKFRNLLQDLNEVQIFLVRGKGGYRITGGNFILNIFFSLKEKKKGKEIFKEKITLIKNIFSLLEKVFLHNEEDKKVFFLLESFVTSLGEINSKDTLKEKEIIFLSKLFFLLGYFDQNELLEKMGEETLESKFSIKEIENLKNKINNNLSKIAF